MKETEHQNDKKKSKGNNYALAKKAIGLEILTRLAKHQVEQPDIITYSNTGKKQWEYRNTSPVAKLIFTGMEPIQGKSARKPTHMKSRFSPRHSSGYVTDMQ